MSSNFDVGTRTPMRFCESLGSMFGLRRILARVPFSSRRL